VLWNSSRTTEIGNSVIPLGDGAIPLLVGQVTRVEEIAAHVALNTLCFRVLSNHDDDSSWNELLAR